MIGFTLGKQSNAWKDVSASNLLESFSLLVYMCMCVCISWYIYGCLCVYIYICVCVCVYVCVYMCVYVCVLFFLLAIGLIKVCIAVS